MVPIVAAIAITISLIQQVPSTKSNTINPNLTKSNEPSSFNIPSPYVKEFLLPNGTWPNGILVDREGAVWTAGTKSSDLISLNAKNGKMKIYPIPHNASKEGNMVWAIVQATDGSILFSGDAQNPLWRFDQSTEKFASIRSLGSAPFQMKVDRSNGNIWFTTLSPFAAGVIGVIQNASSGYQVKEFNLGNETFPSGLSVDGDYVWITEAAAQKIVKFKAITNPNGTVKDIEQILSISPESANLFFATPY